MTNFSPNYTCHCLPSNTVNPPSHSFSDLGLGSLPVVQMIEGDEDGGVRGEAVGRVALFPHPNPPSQFPHGAPELGTGRVPRPLTLLPAGWGWWSQDPCSGAQNPHTPALSALSPRGNPEDNQNPDMERHWAGCSDREGNELEPALFALPPAPSPWTMKPDSSPAPVSPLPGHCVPLAATLAFLRLRALWSL